MIVIYKKYLRVHVCIGAAINYFELNWIEFIIDTATVFNLSSVVPHSGEGKYCVIIIKPSSSLLHLVSTSTIMTFNLMCFIIGFILMFDFCVILYIPMF